MAGFQMPRWARDLDASISRWVTPAVKWIIYINVFAWLVIAILAGLFRVNVYGIFAVTQFSVMRGFVWQFLTYMFVHDLAFGHLFFNMMMLFFFGSVLERTWGRQDFVRFYLFCGILAGLTFELVKIGTALAHGQDIMYPRMMVGASGATYAVLFAFAYLYPEQPVLFALIIPIPARVLVAILILFAFVASLTDRQDTVAHVCHLAGMAYAFLFLKFPHLLHFRLRPRPQRVRPTTYYR